MKRTALILALSLLSGWTAKAAEPMTAQEQQMITLAKELQAQQAKIAENQAAIDAKLASAAEAIRVARIYSSRADR